MIAVRARRRPAGDAGAASLEYAGMLFVVVVVVGSLLVYATPIGSVVYARICAALGAVCGSTAAEQRAGDLGIRCTVARTNRELGYNVAVTGYRGERQDTDGITNFGDGASTVTMTQGGGAGFDGSTSAGGKGAEFTAKATVNGELGYVYNFPAEFGGAAGAQAFLGDERGFVGQSVDIVVPGAQTLDEGVSRAANGTQNFVEDRLLSPVGLGPSAQERAERERDQRAGTADAVTVALSLQGSAGVNVGAGVPVKGPAGQAPGSPGAGKADGPLRAGASIKMVVKGQSIIGLTTGESDSVASSFTGSASVDADVTAVLGLPGGAGQQDIPPFLSLSGQAGAAGSYKVVFDEDGNPSQFVLAYEYKYGGKAGFTPPKLGSREVKIDVGNAGTSVTERTVILDLDTSTAEGRNNRAAFDDMFAVGGVSVDGRTAKIAVPRTTDLPRFLTGWTIMNSRIDQDGFIVDASYDESKRSDDLGIKIAGSGLGGQRASTTRQLTQASLYDNRNGGAEVSLASCEMP